jgi:hypothetical protein
VAAPLSRAVSDANRGMTRLRRRLELGQVRTLRVSPIECQRVSSSVTENWPDCRYGAWLNHGITGDLGVPCRTIGNSPPTGSAERMARSCPFGLKATSRHCSDSASQLTARAHSHPVPGPRSHGSCDPERPALSISSPDAQRASVGRHGCRARCPAAAAVSCRPVARR